MLYPVAQSLCGTLQRENNWKCFILTALIFSCMGAVIWCRFTHVTKVVINFSIYPIKSTRPMSPCDEGYIYIPLAFMAMLYLVYLVECWHCTARIELGYRVGVDTVLQRVQQMREAQPIVWWKAVCYHYVRRKRQVTRYRNGDAYTSTQVYYERVNSHAAASSFVFAYCGVRDISKRLAFDPDTNSITKIRFSKGECFPRMLRFLGHFETVFLSHIIIVTLVVNFALGVGLLAYILSARLRHFARKFIRFCSLNNPFRLLLLPSKPIPLCSRSVASS